MGGIILWRNIHSAAGCITWLEAPRLFRGVRGHAPPPEKKFLNGAIWCVLVYIWIGFVFKITIFYKLSFFLIKISKTIIFYIKSKYFGYTLASYGVILLKKCLEAFHD